MMKHINTLVFNVLWTFLDLGLSLVFSEATIATNNRPMGLIPSAKFDRREKHDEAGFCILVLPLCVGWLGPVCRS